MFHRVVSQHMHGVVGFFNIHLTINLPRNLLMKFFLNRFRFDRIVVMSLWPHFLAHPVDFKDHIHSVECIRVLAAFLAY